jgi:hypothetical protein
MQPNFLQEQKADVKLKTAWEKAKSGLNGYVIRDVILHKQNPENIRSSNEWLLVIPEAYKERILRAAHDSLEMRCNFGLKKTADKIGRVFFIGKSQIKQYLVICIIC